MSLFSKLGVVGAGPMGAGIVQVGLTAGLDVTLFDLSTEAAEKAKTSVLGHINRMVEKGRLDQAIADTAASRLTIASDLGQLSGSELVIEAIIERLEPKQKLFAQLEEIVDESCILASNTSSLSVAAIASECREKSRICGLHFFNPVPLMRLVEVISAPATSDDTIARATTFSELIGKTPVTVKDGPGFLVNLQGRAYSLESLAIAQEGVASPAVVDRIMRDGAGFRMGPFELMDLTGIDVNYAATRFIYEGYMHDPRLKTTPLHALLEAAGRYGRKSGQGFFDYSDGADMPASPAASGKSYDLSVRALEDDGALSPILSALSAPEGTDLTLIAPIGEDCSSVCARLGLDPKTTIAVDLTAIDRKHLTVMAAPGGSANAELMADWLRASGFTVEAIKDSPGFVLQRMIGMIANLACELAQMGIGTPEDIDTAMKLAQNYPRGPFELADWLGASKVHDIMSAIFTITGSDRYRPSLWLRRRAQLGLSVYEPA